MAAEPIPSTPATAEAQAAPQPLTMADFHQELNTLVGKYNVTMDAEPVVSLSNTGLLSVHARIRVMPRQ